jgi:putative aldouronate transport system substrate-binding protein
MKKFLSLLLVLFLISTFVACSNVSEQPNQGETESETARVTTTKATETTTKAVTTTTTKAETTEPENPFKDFYEITWLTQLNADYREGRWDEAELEDLFNVDLQVWPEDGRNTERMAALVAAGDIPDFFFMPGAPRDPFGMYEEKLTRSITLRQMRDWIPGYVEAMEKIPVGFQYNLVPGKTDEYIGFTWNSLPGCQFFYDATCINLDWLEAVGYGFDEKDLVPVKMTVEGYERFNDNIFFTEGHFTFEDLNEILRAFTEDDPDGNGIDDTYGMLYLQESAWTNMTQEGLFGFVHDLNYLYEDPVTGNIVPKYAYTPYKEYLKWVSENLYKGYMVKRPGAASWDKEYQAMSATNKYGIYGANGGGYLSLNSDTYRVYPPQNILLSTDEEARFVIGPMFRGPEGKLVDATYNIDPYGTGTYRVQMVGAQVDDGKLERICRILQYTMFDSRENYYKFTYGIEGIHYKWSGEPYISAMIVTAAADLPEEYRGRLNVFILNYAPSQVQQQIDNAVNYGYWSYMAYMHANGLFEKYALNPVKYISDVYMGKDLYNEYVEENKDINAQLNPIINDFKNRALNGEISNFDQEWAQYIDQLYANGLQTLVDKYYNNSAFQTYDPGLKFTIKE